MYVISLKVWYNVYSRQEWHYPKDDWCKPSWYYLGPDNTLYQTQITKAQKYGTFGEVEQAIEQDKAFLLENTPLEHIGNIEYRIQWYAESS